MGKKFIAIDGKVEYSKKGAKLSYEGEQWGQNDGKKAYSIEDTGSGYIFRDHFLKIKLSLDYTQFEALAILMKTDADLDRIKVYTEEE